jgi:hypothetical protein
LPFDLKAAIKFSGLIAIGFLMFIVSKNLGSVDEIYGIPIRFKLPGKPVKRYFLSFSSDFTVVKTPLTVKSIRRSS